MRQSLPKTSGQNSPVVSVELFGVPRLLAGTRDVRVSGDRLGDIAAGLRNALPVLAGKVLDRDSGWPLDGYIFVVDGTFTRDPDQPVPSGTPVLLVSSVAGG